MRRLPTVRLPLVRRPLACLAAASLTVGLACLPSCLSSEPEAAVRDAPRGDVADVDAVAQADSDPVSTADAEPSPAAGESADKAAIADAPQQAPSPVADQKIAAAQPSASAKGDRGASPKPMSSRLQASALNSFNGSSGNLSAKRGKRAARAAGASVGDVGIGRVGTVGRGSGNASYRRSAATSSVRSVRTPGKAGPRMASKSMASKSMVSKSMPSGRSARVARMEMKKARRMAPAEAPYVEPTYAEADPGGTFKHAGTNPFTETSEDKLSTFAIDVDTASYTYGRRFLKNGNRPRAGSVRVEEWVNAFHYEYNNPRGQHPFGIEMEAGPSPLDEGRHILRVGIQGKKVSAKDRKPAHLTFLVDVSGSMGRHDKLPLAQKALHHLVDNLSSKDSVALITYAGRTAEILPQTSARHKSRIHRAIDGLRSGGGTAMGSGMEMAYRNAGKFVAPGSISRVIVLSDGDANIGATRHGDILSSIKGYVSEGIKMSTVGFGTGNYRDHQMEQLADAGDGNYSYIDSYAAAKKVFGKDLSGTLQVIAKDVKIQVEMNPKVVKRYRLLGYENRDVADKDFRNDKVDAGEIGAGHSVTALYEVELHDPYGKVRTDVATVRVRYKKPRGTKATEVTKSFTQNHVRTRFGDLDRDTRWAAAVSLAAEVLRGSPYAADKSLEDAWALAAEAAGGKYAKERRELVDLLDRTHKREALAVR